MRHITQPSQRLLHQLLRTFARGAFSDALRQRRLEAVTQYEPGSEPSKPVVEWDPDDAKAKETALRKKLRSVDFVVEVRDARIPVSTLHPELRQWIGKKPRIMVFNKADLISHRDRVEWERHFEQKNMHVIWTAATMKKGGIANLVRRFFDANFEVNRRRRRTNLPLRSNRAVLTCLVGHPNVGKKTLIERLIGPNRKVVQNPIPHKGRPDLVDPSLTWYRVEGGVYLMHEPGVIPPLLENQLVSARLAMCGNFDKAEIQEPQLAEQLIAHLGSLRRSGQIMERIYEDVSVHPGSLPPTDFLREVAEVKFEGDVTSAAQHLLAAFQRLDYGPIAIEMPYMLHSNFKMDDPLIYDKDTATGVQNGICSQF